MSDMPNPKDEYQIFTCYSTHHDAYLFHQSK